MNVKFKRTYLKDLEKLPGDIKRGTEELSFLQIPKIQKLVDMTNVKKIKGYKSFYRVRIGDYRIGFELRNGVIVFYRVLHRKDIYKYFP